MLKSFFRIIAFSLLLSACKTTVNTGSSTSEETKIYRAGTYRSAYTRRADLINTKLFLTPVWKKKEMNGRAEITLRQHFYPSDSIVLNAREMVIHSVSLLQNGSKKELKYDYDAKLLTVRLDRTYNSAENIVLSIEYTSYPEKAEQGGSNAIKSDKGLYFIDADSTDDGKPTELWSQGETESNSVWFPTIESPEQKTTSEIYLTIDSAFTTLSNGLLIDTKINPDGTKTDHWLNELPIAPYLVMIAAGNFAVVKDKWRNIDVNYYVDPPFAPYAKMVFGNTPEMIEYFSNLTGIPYAWQKYSQVVVHDYISGAMENATAVVHGTNMHQDVGSHLDESYEHYIAHELFHHWFGNLVTCRSWSNITLNEGFANYSEYLWYEHKYGKTYAESALIEDLNQYLGRSEKSDPPLIRYVYEDREDVYDVVSYNKGGSVLHMLRDYLGDSAFFKGMNVYLSTYKFGSAEVDQLRASFEKVCGEDLNWFFNQWYLSGGHPELAITYSWNELNKEQTIQINQLQDHSKYPIYRLPLKVDFYFNDSIVRKNIYTDRTEQTFNFPFSEKPKVVSVDANRTLVGRIKDNRTPEELSYLYDHSKHVADRLQAISAISYTEEINSTGSAMQVRALKDSSYLVRREALNYTMTVCKKDPARIQQAIIDIALNDADTKNRTNAISKLTSFYSKEISMPVLEKGLKEKSHHVVAASFFGIYALDTLRGREVAKQLEKDSSEYVLSALTLYYSENDSDDVLYIYENAMKRVDRWEKFSIADDLHEYLLNTKRFSNIRDGVKLLEKSALNSQINLYRTRIMKWLKEVNDQLNSTMDNAKLEKWSKHNNNASKESIKSSLSELSDQITTAVREIKIAD
jgi:aminopeptidase N